MRLLFLVVLLAASFLQAKAVSDKDLTVQKDYEAKFGNIKAQVLHFGGVSTPKCQFAISNDGQYFYFTKLNSTCKRLKNSKGMKIVCNSDKSVCKTRKELIGFLKNGTSNDLKNSSNADLIIHKDYEAKFGNIEAQVLHFGGASTPNCQFAISNDGEYFYFTKLDSTCKRLTNSKGEKIVCNSDKSVCKTREELIEFVQNSQNNEEDSKKTVTKENNNENAEIKKFLTKFINSSNQDNLDKILSFYTTKYKYIAPYFNLKKATLNEIKKDKIRFFKKWSKRNYSLVDYSIIKKDDWYETAIHYFKYTVRAVIDWKVSNNKKEASGRTVNEIIIMDTDIEPDYAVVGIKSIKNDSTNKLTKNKVSSISSIKNSKDFKRIKKEYLRGYNEGYDNSGINDRLLEYCNKFLPFSYAKDGCIHGHFDNILKHKKMSDEEADNDILDTIKQKHSKEYENLIKSLSKQFGI